MPKFITLATRRWVARNVFRIYFKYARSNFCVRVAVVFEDFNQPRVAGYKRGNAKLYLRIVERYHFKAFVGNERTADSAAQFSFDRDILHVSGSRSQAGRLKFLFARSGCAIGFLYQAALILSM